MHFDLALFISELQSVDDPRVAIVMETIAAKMRIASWHLYKVASPHTCLEHIPGAFFCYSTRLWHQPDKEQEKPALRFAKRRQKAFAAIYSEEEHASNNPTVTAARCLVRFEVWKAEHPIPLTPWRLYWRQALLEYATQVVVYIDCTLQAQAPEDQEACP